MSPRIHADCNASCPLGDAARDAMGALLHDPPANPGSVHQEGQRARAIVERARGAALELLGTRGGRFIFTSGATEANNTLIGALSGRRVAVSIIEHASVIEPARRFEASGGEVEWLPVDALGRLDLKALEKAVEHGADAVLVGAANGEIGNIEDLDAVSALCSRQGTRLHVDAAQLYGRMKWQVPPGVTSVTVSGHKFGAPQGVGGLWVSGEVPESLMVGGAQERGARAGTENVIAIAGFGAACEAFDPAPWGRLGHLRDRFERDLLEGIGARVNGDRASRLPNTTNLVFPGVDAEELLQALDLEGVACSAGAACSAGSTEVSHVIRALGLPDDDARTCLRFSFCPGTSEATVDELTARVIRVYGRCARLRSGRA